MDRVRRSSPAGRAVSHPEGTATPAVAPRSSRPAAAPPCPENGPLVRSALHRTSAQHAEQGVQESSQPCSSMGHRDGQCPVCLQTANFPVTTNCGHLFCAPCLIAYWRHGSWLSAISCPVCRQEVNVLRRLFSDSQSSDGRLKEVLVDITDYNRRYSGAPRKVMDYLWDAPLFLQLLARGLTAVGCLVWLFFFRVALCCVGTLISFSSHPLDNFSASSSSATPETGPSLCGMLGVLDDLVVVTLLLICVINIHQQMEPERGRSANVLHGVL